MPKKRILPETPDPDAEVIALSPKSLTSTDQFVCEICNKAFPRRQNLQLHLRGHNHLSKRQAQEEDDDDEEDQQLLQNEMELEEGEEELQLQGPRSEELRKRIYVCPEPSCVHHAPAWAFGHITAIKRHFCRKHGEKKWKCTRCLKEYAVEADWKAHSKICGINDHRCDCGVSFSRSLPHIFCCLRI